MDVPERDNEPFGPPEPPGYHDGVANIDAGRDPNPGPDSALPSVAARAVAFLAIFVGGAAGALIGRSFATLSCDGACALRQGLWLWGGSLIGAAGVAVIASLTLRAVAEWAARTDPTSS